MPATEVVNVLQNRRHIFLSYRSVEVDFALRLAADLKNAGLNLWIDRLDIKPGEDWRRSLQTAVDECAALIAVLTPEYVKSRYCQRELARADRFDRPIFPLLLKPIPETDWPMEIERQQYIDFSGWRDESVYAARLAELVDHFREQFADQFHDVPDAETRYLTSLVAELEATKSVVELVELSHQANRVLSDEVMIRPKPAYASAWTMEGAFSVVPDFADLPARPLRARAALNGIAEAVERYPRFVLIGPPGTGKTTTIQHLVLAAAYARLQEPAQNPLPLFLKLTNWRENQSAEAFVRAHWPLDGDPIERLNQGDVALYLDGLNETAPTRAQQLREWLKKPEAPRMVIVTCRSHEYSDALNLHLPTVQVAEMDRSRIQQFVHAYLDDGAAERLLDLILPNEYQATDNARHLFQLARNPFLLSVLVLIFMRSPDGELPQNSGTLLKALITEVWHQEQLHQYAELPSLSELENGLAGLAFTITDTDQPIYVPRLYALDHIRNQAVFEAAVSARLLECEGDNVRFSNQLIQDYFAALGLVRHGLPTRLEQATLGPHGLRQPTKWDHVIIALCGIISHPDSVVRAVAEVDPFLGLQCVASGISILDTTRDQVIAQAFTAIHGRGQPGRVQVAALLLEMDHEAALPVLLAAMREGPWSARVAAYDIFRQTWMPDFPGLTEALQESSAEMREATITALIQIGSKVVPNLLQLLRDEQWVLRRSAAWALGEMRESAAVPGLVDLMTDDDPVVGVAAVGALGRIGDEGAVAALVETLYHGHWRLKHAVATALGQIGDRTALAALLKALNEQDDDLRCLAVEGLKYISNAAAQSALLQASYDESAEVRGAVVDALKDTEDARAVNRLIELLTDTSWIRSAKTRVNELAAKALTASGARNALAAVERWRKGQAKPAQAAAVVGTNGIGNKKTRDAGVDRLNKDLQKSDSPASYHDLDSPDWLRRRRAVQWLAGQPLDFALPKLIAKLADEDSQVRLAAVQVLSGIGDNDEVINGLISALGDDDALVCDAAAQGLASQGKKVVAPLLAALASPSANVRGAAVEALAKIGDKSAVTPLAALLTDVAHPWLAEHRICDLAGRALLSIGTPDARSAVKKWRETELGKTFQEKPAPRAEAAAEPEPERRERPSGDRLLELLYDLQEAEWGKREETAKQLREYARGLKGKDASLDVQRLIGATQDEDWVVRWAASDALAWIGDQSAVPHIVRLLNDENWTVRIGAVRNLTELADPAAVPSLVAIANDENHNIREVVAEALGVFGDVSTLDTLLELAEDEERFVRHSAVEALGKIGTDKVHTALIKALQDEHVTVRRAAVEAVRSLKIEAAVPTLIELLQDVAGLEWEDDRICDMAVIALEQIGTEAAKTAAAEWRRSQPELQ